MAGRTSKLRIETLGELKQTLGAYPGCEMGLLVRSDRKIEMEIDAKVIAELQKMLQKVAGHHKDDEY